MSRRRQAAAKNDGLVMQNLKVNYGSARVLKGVGLRIEPNQLVGLCGRNGAGKTTMLRAISGLVPRSGSIELDGVSLASSPHRTARAGVAHVPEGRGLFASMPVALNLRLGALAVGRSPRAEDVEFVLDLFPILRPLLDRVAGTLSGGEQQMVAIARGVLSRPKVLMIDEMSLGLSPAAVEVLLGALPRIVTEHGTSVLLVDQNVRSLFEVCDRVYVLDQGTTVHSEDIESEAIRLAYLG